MGFVMNKYCVRGFSRVSLVFPLYSFNQFTSYHPSDLSRSCLKSLKIKIQIPHHKHSAFQPTWLDQWGLIERDHLPP